MKSPISPIWLGESFLFFSTLHHLSNCIEYKTKEVVCIKTVADMGSTIFLSRPPRLRRIRWPTLRGHLAYVFLIEVQTPPGWSLYNLGEIVTEGSKSGIQLATSVGASRYIFGGTKEPPFFAGELQQSEESAEDRSRVHCAG